MQVVDSILQKQVLPHALYRQSIAGRDVLPRDVADVIAATMPGDETLAKIMLQEPAVKVASGKLQSRIVSAGFRLMPGTGYAAKLVHKLVSAVLSACEVWELVEFEATDFPFYGWKPYQIQWHPGAVRGGWGIKTITAEPPWQYWQTAEDTLIRYVPPDEPIEICGDGLKSWVVAKAGLGGWPYGEWTLGPVFLLWWLRGLIAGRLFARRHTMGPVGVMSLTGDSPLVQPGAVLADGAGKAIDYQQILEAGQKLLEVLEETGIVYELPGSRFRLESAQGRSEPEALQLFRLLGEEIERAMTLEYMTSGAGTSLAGAKSATGAVISAALMHAANSTAFLRKVIRRIVEVNFGEIDPEDHCRVRSRLVAQPDMQVAQALGGWGALLDLEAMADSGNVPLSPNSPLEGTGQTVTTVQAPGLPGADGT